MLKTTHQFWYRSILFIILQLLATIAYSQAVITGKLLDRITKSPISAAMVISSVDTAVSDQKGNFEIMTITEISNALVIRHVSYGTIKVNIASLNNVNITLEPKENNLQEVVISALALDIPLSQTNLSASILSPKMMQRNDPFDLSTSINRIPGVYMHSGTLSTNRFTIRGIGSRSLFATDKIKLYYGDIPITDGSGNSSIEDFDPSMLGRVELIKGPNSSIFGGGLAGAVKIVPRTPSLNESSFETSLSMGSFGTQRIASSLSIGSNKNTLSVLYNHLSSAGYRQNNDYSRHQMVIGGSITLSDKSQIDIHAIHTEIASGIPSAINATSFANDSTSAAPTWLSAKGKEEFSKTIAGLTYAYSINDRWKLKSTLFYTTRKAAEDRPFNILDENTGSMGNRSSFNYANAKTSAVFGTELFFDKYSWSTFRNLYNTQSNGSVKGAAIVKNLENRWYSNLFGELRHRFSDQWALDLGFNLNFTNYQLMNENMGNRQESTSNSGFEPVVSPRIGLSYHTVYGGDFYINISHGFSPPTLSETQRPDGTINPSIRPESGWNFEIGHRYTYQGLYTEVTAYAMRIQDLLVAQRTGDDAYVGVNAGLNHHFGLDLSSGYALKISNQKSLHFFTTATMAHYRFIDFINRDIDFGGNMLTGMPALQINPGIELDTDQGFYGNITAQIVSEIPMNDANSLFADPYHVFRGKFGYHTTFRKWKIDLASGINNVFNQKYASMLLINATAPSGIEPRYFYPALPRHFFSSFQLSYNLGRLQSF